MLLELDRKERVSKLESLSSSKEVNSFLMYQDYYAGVHFVKNGNADDYGKNQYYSINTRSGNPIFDEETTKKPLVSMNWCKPIIEVIGDLTRGVNEEMMINGEGIEEIEKVWKNNNIDILTQELSYGAGINGKTYIRIRKRDTNEIEIFQVDPTTIYEVFDPLTDDRKSVIHFFIISSDIAEATFKMKFDKEDVIYAEEWTPQEVHKYIDGELINDDKFINPYDAIPFVEVPANIYRQSDISDVIHLNDALNTILTFNSEIIKYQAFPLLAPKGTLDNNFRVLDKTMLKDVKISPRSIMPVPMERIVSGGIDQSVLDYISQIERDISIESGIPMKLLTAEVDGNTSGVALKRMMATAFNQAEIRRGYITNAYKEATNIVSNILGIGEKEVDFVFPEMVNIDQNEVLDQAIKKQTLGISRKTILEELGYDYEEENIQKEEELEQQLLRIKQEQDAVATNNQPIEKKGAQNREKNNNRPFGRA